jgi:hypothetical protein
MALAVAGLALASPRLARADDEDPPPVGGPPAVWYGWQTLAVDAGATALLDLATRVKTARSQEAALVAGLAVYGFGGPAVHLAHGEVKKAGESLALRVGLPLAGALVGALAGGALCGEGGGDDEVDCPAILGGLGFLGGGIAAIAVDGAALARTSAKPSGVASVQPVLVPRTGGGGFSLAGRF